jgi:hypothetical protein
MVLPVPGGPDSKAPFGILAPIFLYFAGFFKKSTSSLIYTLEFPSPAMSLNLIFGLYPSFWPKTLVLNTFPMLELNSKMGKIKGRITLLTEEKNLFI